MARLHEITGAELGVQAYVGRRDEARPQARLLRPPRNAPARPKPDGGLWTSTYLGPEAVSDWIRWCRAEQWGDRDLSQRIVWLLEPEPEARVLQIRGRADLGRLLDVYRVAYDFGGLIPAKLTPDFEAIAAAGFDAVSLTEDGQWRTRFGPALDEPDLYGWDCESTIWLRWRFASVRRLEDAAEAVA